MMLSMRSTARRIIADVPVQQEPRLPWTEPCLSSSQLSCIVLEVFEGLEDFVEHELRLALRSVCRPNLRTRTVCGCGHVVIETIQAEPSASDVKVAGELVSATSFITALHLTSRLPAVRSSYLLVHQEQLPQDLLDGLYQETSKDGAKELRKRAHRKPLRSERVDPSDPAGQSRWSEHEDRLLRQTEAIWKRAVSTEALNTSLKAWTQLFRAAAGADGGLSSTAEIKTSFRFTFDRCHYFFPLLRNQDVQKEISYLAWHWLNGPSWDNPQWKVSLEHADLDITLKVIPSLWISGTSGSTSGGDNALSKQVRSSNPPGSLAILLRLPEPPPTTIPAHRQNLSAFNTLANSTALLRYRAAALSLVASLPEYAFLPSAPDQDTVKILEPCCGTGGLAVELAAAIARRRPSHEQGDGKPVEIYACDIDKRFAKRASEVFLASGFPTRSAEQTANALSPPPSRSNSVTLISGHIDSSNADKLAEFVQAPESIDLIMTDLPWGYRVLSQTKLIALYTSLLSSFLHVLKPGAYAYLITAGSNVLLRALKEHKDAQAGSVGAHGEQRYALQMVRIGSPSQGEETTASDIIPEGQEASGLKEVVIGYTVYLCALRKHELSP